MFFKQITSRLTPTLTPCLVLLSILLASCASGPKNRFAGMGEQILYLSAQNDLRNNRFLLAIETLQKMESDFPFGKYANAAQLALIYAYFKSNDLALAISSANRYIRLHPNHPNVDYAYYLRALSAFPKPTSFFQQIFGADLSKKDMQSTQQAFTYFSDLITLFPESDYRVDSLQRMTYLRNLLARHEIHAGNYYLEREAFLAAVNRGRYVVENFQHAPSMPDALALMVQGYYELGLNDLADDALTILKANYPDYPALLKNGQFDRKFYKKGTRSLIGILTFGLIDYSERVGFDTRKHYALNAIEP